MIQREEYLKAKQVVQNYENQNNGLSWIEKDDLAGKRLIELYSELPENSILFVVSNKVLRKLIIEGIDIGLNYR